MTVWVREFWHINACGRGRSNIEIPEGDNA